MMAWTYLLIASCFEIVFALGLKYTDGFTRLRPSVLTVAAGATFGVTVVAPCHWWHIEDCPAGMQDGGGAHRSQDFEGKSTMQLQREEWYDHPATKS
jgi:hypothetical protein